MANKMLIDATHPEETRVVVLRGNRVEEFDFEFAQRKQLRGNIYLAKVTRVEPSLQAAFVDYGGNRHGFLAFSEIHPDYYQIPVADRQALIDEEGRAQRAAEDEDDRDRRSRRHRGNSRPSQARRGDEVCTARRPRRTNPLRRSQPKKPQSKMRRRSKPRTPKARPLPSRSARQSTSNSSPPSTPQITPRPPRPPKPKRESEAPVASENLPPHGDDAEAHDDTLSGRDGRRIRH